MEPKAASLGIAGILAGIWTGVGIIDNPAMLFWLLVGSFAGTVSSLSLIEHGRPRVVPRTILSIAVQLFTGFCSGLLAAPIAVMAWQADPPYKPESVAGVAFVIALLAWLFLDTLLPAILKRITWLISEWTPWGRGGGGGGSGGSGT